MTVYYALAQQRAMGRLLHARQIRAWIRGTAESSEPELIVDALAGRKSTRQLSRVKRRILLQAFLPGQASVITVSAPEQLLSASLFSLLSGLGVYLAFIWQRGLDTNAGTDDSKNVFIVFTVSLAVCLAIYSLSTIVQSDKYTKSPTIIVEENLAHFTATLGIPKVNEDDDKGPEAMKGEEDDESLSGQYAWQPRGHEDVEAMAADLRSSITDTIVRPTSTSTDEVLVKAARGQPFVNKDPKTSIVSGTNASDPVQEPVGVTKFQGTTENSSALPIHEQLVLALQESARLRRESAKADELAAQYYEQVLRN